MDRTYYRISNIIGHERSVQFLNGLFVNDRIPSGLIFYGQKNIGKLFTALSFAASVLCKDYSLYNRDAGLLELEEKDLELDKYFCGTCPSCTGVLNGTNQNLIFTEPEGNSIKIDKIHRINSLLNLTPAFGGHRFVIIDDASSMNPSAMSALLKILEEPPDNTVFILISPNINGLLQTIVSRCSLLNFRPVGDELLFKAFKSKFPDMSGAVLMMYMRLAKGSYSNLERLVIGKYFETRKSILALIFNELFYKNPALLMYDMSDAFNGILKNFKNSNEDRTELFEIFLFILRDIFIYYMTKNEKLLYNIDICEDIGKFIKDSHITPDRLLGMIELTVSYIDKMSYNFNKTIAMDAYFSDILTQNVSR